MTLIGKKVNFGMQNLKIVNLLINAAIFAKSLSLMSVDQPPVDFKLMSG